MLTRLLFLLTVILGCLPMTTSVGAADLASTTFFAPAAPPTYQMDSLPQGRHVVSTYRNGSSTKVTVEDGQIKFLEIDGKVIPPTEYGNYQQDVERMLGTGEDNTFYNDRQPLEWLDENQLDRRLEGYEERFERLGENWEDVGSMFEKMAERLGSRFEAMFDMESNDNLFRFEFRGDGDGQYFLDVDSLPPGQNFTSPRPKEWNDAPSAEDEIREMETMIEQLERRKAEMKRQMEEQQNDGESLKDESENGREDAAKAPRSTTNLRVNDIEINTQQQNANLDQIVAQLREEGLTDITAPVDRIKLTNNTLKINGQLASDEAQRRFVKLYEQQTGSRLRGEYTVEIKQ